MRAALISAVFAALAVSTNGAAVEKRQAAAPALTDADVSLFWVLFPGRSTALTGLSHNSRRFSTLPSSLSTSRRPSTRRPCPTSRPATSPLLDTRATSVPTSRRSLPMRPSTSRSSRAPFRLQARRPSRLAVTTSLTPASTRSSLCRRSSRVSEPAPTSVLRSTFRTRPT
jgi:hypothetical protein